MVSIALKVCNWRTCGVSHMFHLDASTCSSHFPQGCFCFQKIRLFSVSIIPKSLAAFIVCFFFRRSCHGPCWIRRMTTRQPLMFQKMKPLAFRSHPRRPDGNPVGLDMVENVREKKAPWLRRRFVVERCWILLFMV